MSGFSFGGGFRKQEKKKLNQAEREDRALEAIMSMCIRMDMKQWSKKRQDRFWKKVYEIVDAKAAFENKSKSRLPRLGP